MQKWWSIPNIKKGVRWLQNVQSYLNKIIKRKTIFFSNSYYKRKYGSLSKQIERSKLISRRWPGLAQKCDLGEETWAHKTSIIPPMFGPSNETDWSPYTCIRGYLSCLYFYDCSIRCCTCSDILVLFSFQFY